MDCKQYLNSCSYVESNRSGMLSFPLGFREGPDSNACPVERQVRASRTTDGIFMVVICVETSVGH